MNPPGDLTAADVETLLDEHRSTHVFACGKCQQVMQPCPTQRLARALQAAWRELKDWRRESTMIAICADGSSDDQIPDGSLAAAVARRIDEADKRAEQAEAERDQARRERHKFADQCQMALMDVLRNKQCVEERDAAQREVAVLREALIEIGRHDACPEESPALCLSHVRLLAQRAIVDTQPTATAYAERVVREGVAPWRQVVESIEAELLLTADPWAHRGRALRLASDALRASSRSLLAPASETKR